MQVRSPAKEVHAHHMVRWQFLQHVREGFEFKGAPAKIIRGKGWRRQQVIYLILQTL